MRRIGILAQGFIDWAGGIDFLYSVADGIRASGDSVEMHLLLPEPRPKHAAARWLQAARDAWSRRSLVASEIPAPPGCEEVAALCAATHRIARGRRGINAAIERLGIDVLLPSHAPLPRRIDRPWIGYIYDFQHRRLPELFTDREKRQRDRRFSAIVSLADAVIVNSRDTATEARAAYPEHARKIRALPFNASPREHWFSTPNAGAPSTTGDAVRGHEYFMVSNQFWVHKDHPTAFRAFARLASRNPNVRLVCTGQTSDYRRPDYFPGVLQLLAELGIGDRVIITGLLPKLEQIALLRGSVALIQPTLCEGGPGGGAVYDAVALGVRSIVSNIEINKELAAEPTVTFFPTGDAESLAVLMGRALETPSPPPPEGELRAAGQRRRAACGRVILDLIDEISSSKR